MENRNNKPVIVNFLLGAVVGLLLGITVTYLHYLPVIDELHDRIKMGVYNEMRLTEFPQEREAINMEDRTISHIIVNHSYKQHQCVWVDARGVVCDSCRDAMMYMILDNIDTVTVSSTK
jgi:hypothetical protein